MGYKVTSVTVQQDDDILVKTFTEDVDVIENDKSVTSEPSPALVTFVRVDGQWKVASEAFFSKKTLAHELQSVALCVNKCVSQNP